MEQTNIYEFLGMENDPVFSKVSSLKSGHSTDLGGVKASLNQQGLYEIETPLCHECFRSESQVYYRLSKFLNLIVL